MKRIARNLLAASICAACAFASAGNGPMAWYKFNGDLSDASGNEYKLIGRGVKFTTDRNNQSDRAVVFDGTGWLSMVYDDMVKGDLTVSVWAKPTADCDLSYPEDLTYGTYYKQPQVVLYPTHGGYEAGDLAGVGLVIGKNGIVMMEHRDCYFARSIVYPCDLGAEWTHIALTVSGNNKPRLYVNGKLVHEGLASPKTKFIGMNFRGDMPHIGGYNGNFYQGALDDLRIYNRALTDSDVWRLYSNGETK